MAIMMTDIPANVCAIASDLHAAASARNHAFVASAMENRKSIYILSKQLARNIFDQGSLHEQELTLLIHVSEKGV
jgi:hypothetical protein